MSLEQLCVFFFYSDIFSLSHHPAFPRTFLGDGGANIQIRGLVFDVLCQGENVL